MILLRQNRKRRWIPSHSPEPRKNLEILADQNDQKVRRIEHLFAAILVYMASQSSHEEVRKPRTTSALSALCYFAELDLDREEGLEYAQN